MPYRNTRYDQCRTEILGIINSVHRYKYVRIIIIRLNISQGPLWYVHVDKIAIN